MKPEGWERTLLAATERVRRRISALKAGDGGRVLGVGASGDNTLHADKVAEDVLLKTLNKTRELRILSEEAGLLGDMNAMTLAVVDPLDGSSNFERGIPFYCTAVAIVEGNSIDGIIVGVVRDLVSGDAYSAVKGRGAKKNGKTIRTSEASKLSKAVVGIDLSRGGTVTAEQLAPLLGSVKRQVHFGANALELCLMAEGRTDAFVDLRGRIRITDFAAAYLVAAEAGAVITKSDGTRITPTFDLSHRLDFVASANETLHKQILELLEKQAGGQTRSR